MSEQHAQGADAVVDLNNELKTRREKLANLREQGIAFPNDFRRDHTSDQLHAEFDGKENEELEALNIEVAVAGRMMTRRIMGKASFVTLQDVGGRIQLYVARDDLPEGVYNEQFKKWDLGDILGAKGKLFKTKTGELSIHCTELRLLTKALRPLPDKFHGLQDQEARYRQRYLDLISNDESRNTFKVRSQILSGIRQFMVNRDKAMSILQEEASLNEIVQLVGKDSLSAADQLTLETAKMLREDFLQQNGFMEVDWYSSYERQDKMIQMILDYDKLCRAAIEKGAATAELFAIPFREQMGRAKSVPDDRYAAVYADMAREMEEQIADIAARGGAEE